MTQGQTWVSRSGGVVGADDDHEGAAVEGMVGSRDTWNEQNRSRFIAGERSSLGR